MSNFAQTIVIGNLGKDPVLFNNDASKAPMCIGTLAVGGKYPQRDTNGNILKDANGKNQYNEYTTWYDFQIHGPRAVSFAQHHHKGMQTQLIGEMRDKDYDTKLALTPCYDGNGQPLMDANGQHFHAYTTHKAKGKFLRVNDWNFMDNKPAGNAYAAPANPVVGQPAVGYVNVPQKPQMPQMPQYANVQPGNVQAAFTGQPYVQAPVQPQMTQQPQQFVMPQSTIPQGV